MTELDNQGGSTALENRDDNYITAATSTNTRRAYHADIQHFLKAGGSLPATSKMLVTYLRTHAATQNPRTLVRRMIGLRQWHKLSNQVDPTQDALVKKTLRGITRLHGRPKRQALAMRLESLDTISKYLLSLDTIKSIRDRALILVGFFGAFRRSELVSLAWEQVRFESEGLIVNLTRSKTDQIGEGAVCVIPFGNNIRCPLRALLAWRGLQGLGRPYFYAY